MQFEFQERILDPRGIPVAGARSNMLKCSGAMDRDAKSDEQGCFILDDIDPVEYRLTPEEPTLVAVILDVSVAHGQQEQVTLSFRQPASVSQAITVLAPRRLSIPPKPSPSMTRPDEWRYGMTSALVIS
jgi:hypothetical protein